MTAQVGGKHFVTPSIVAAVALIHIGLIALLISISVPMPRDAGVAIVDIAFAEILNDPPAETDPEPLPDLVPAFAPDHTSQVEPSVPTAESDGESDGLDVDEPEILTQSERDTKARAAQTTDEGSTKIAAVLQRLSCQKLTVERDEDCPVQNPFDLAESIARRDTATSGPAFITVFDQKGAVERFFARQNQRRHMFPGMNADMFADPMAPGAYDAERIRNGHEPLWSDEMKRGFTKRDE